MKKFKVINSKGFCFGGKLLEKGDTFESETKSAHVQTGLHFKQVEEIAGEGPEKGPGKAGK
jgi:hypothetical protein